MRCAKPSQKSTSLRFSRAGQTLAVREAEMFVGHFGVSFAATALVPDLPLPLAMLATQLPDLIWSVLVLAKIERVKIVPGFTATNAIDLEYMPYSHGLMPMLVASVTAGALCLAFPGFTSANVGVAVALLAISHWVLDLIVHTPDLPLWGNRYKVGFGLWNSRAAALALELFILFAGAALLYAQTASLSLAALTLALAALHLYSVFGPVPKSSAELAASALLSYIVIAALSAYV